MLKNGPTRRNLKRSSGFRAFIAQGNFSPEKPEAKEFWTAALLDIVFEYHGSIGALLMLGMSTSALALLRTLIETSYRLIWLNTCASPKQIKDIVERFDDKFPDLSRIITALVNSSKLTEFRTQIPTIRLLNSLAHTGSISIVQRFLRHHQKELSFEQEAFLCLFYADHILLLIGVLFLRPENGTDHPRPIAEKYWELQKSYEVPQNIPPTLYPPEHSAPLNSTQ